MSATPATMLHVVASGLQDQERLNVSQGNPSITFYKSVLHRRTRWASQWRRVEFDNVADFGRTATCTLPINGELITRVTLVVELPDIYSPQINAINNFAGGSNTQFIVGPSWAWTNGVGHALCSDVQFLINDQKIDQFDSQLLEVIDESERPVEHLDSTNLLIARDPTAYSDQQMINLYNDGVFQPKATVPQSNPQTVEVVFPFWFNKGPGATPLPIEALKKDKVQLRVTFRPVQDLVYTSTRISSTDDVIQLNPPLSANQGAGPLPAIAGCGFFYADPAGPLNIYNPTSSANMMALGLTMPDPADPFSGNLVPNNSVSGGVTRDFTMPSEYHFTDAFWIVEYVSLEDREASAFRMADLDLPITQHLAIPPVTTGGAEKVFVPLNQSGLVRDLTWVAQRVEAPSYNAHFLFSRDLAQRPVDGTNGSANICDFPWWPDALLPDWDYGDGYIVPAFSTRFSDPITDAKLTYRSLLRFDHESPSIFRSLIPALNCRRVPLIDRYIYRYDFGFWSSGGIAETLALPSDEIRGCANWDKLPKRVLALTMDQRTFQEFGWTMDMSQDPVGLVTQDDFNNPVNVWSRVDTQFTTDTEGLFVVLQGADPEWPNDAAGNSGYGAVIQCMLDMNAMRRRPGFAGIFARLNSGGSASLVLKDAGGYTWLSVAGGGGRGQIAYGGGGSAGSAVEIGWQGGNATQTQDAATDSGGIYVYNNIAPTNIVAPTALTSYTSPTFPIVISGRFQTVQMKFSINTSTVTQPIVIKMYHLDSSGVIIGSPYTLTAPTSTVYVPIKTYTLSLPSTHVNFVAGDQMYFTVEVTSALTLNPFSAMVEEDGVTLACKATIKGNPTTPSTTFYGGGGGGLAALNQAGIGSSGLISSGPSIAFKMPTTASFVENHQQTGATAYSYHGGDGYYGGGAGSVCGGGGGSYVSNLVNSVYTFTSNNSSWASCNLSPFKRLVNQPPSFNILSWITRYNRLRINSGHGVLMFSDAS